MSSCENCAVLRDVIRDLSASLGKFAPATKSVVVAPQPPASLGLDGKIEQALARRAGSDIGLRTYLTGVAVDMLAAGADPIEVANAVLEGER